MTCSASYAPRLRARGFRMTPQRMAILHVLYQAHGHLSPTQVYDLSRKELPGITEPTVYRTLEFLVANGFALAAHMGSGKLVYELAGSDHHHLVCRKCGCVVDVEHAQLERLYRQLEISTGYKLDSIHMTFFGLCPACQS
jgi:Fe2+ or Zn2+ uptake regulation protein